MCVIVVQNRGQRNNRSTWLLVGQAFLRNRKIRRNVIFGFTLLTLFLVFGGSVVLGEKLMDSPRAFLLFWGIVIFLVGLILMLAVYDIGRIRKDHRERVRKLDAELKEAAEEAERLAEKAINQVADEP